MKYLIFSLLILIIQPDAHAQMVVVVSKNSPIVTLNNQKVANIFLARTNRFPNGDRATPIELKNNSYRIQFYQRISGKSDNQLNAYWTTLVFTGQGKPPKTSSSYERLIKQLINNPGTISYMLAEQVTTDLKVIYKFP